MSKLARLISETGVEEKPRQSVIIQSLDGSEMSEDNITIDIFNKPNLEHFNMDEEVNRHFNILDTVKDLTSLLKKMRLEGESKENMVLVANSIDRLASLNKKETLSMESFDFVSDYDRIDNMISTEGLWDFIKAVFRTIRDLIVGFFKAIWSAIKSMFETETRTDKVKKSNDNRIKRIVEDKLSIPEDRVKTIATHITILARCPDQTNPSPSTVVSYSEAMYDKFLDFVNNVCLPALKKVESEFIPSLRELMRTIHSSEITSGTLVEFKNILNKILKTIDEMRTTLTPYPSTSATPAQVAEKFADIDNVKITYDIKSAIDDSDESKLLSRRYNIYGLFFKGGASIDAIARDNDFNSSIFVYRNFEVADDTKYSTSFNILPITDREDLKRLNEVQDNVNKKINFTDLEKSIKRISDGITQVVDYMAEIGYLDLEKLKVVVELNSSLADITAEVITSLSNEDSDGRLKYYNFLEGISPKSELFDNKVVSILRDNGEFIEEFIVSGWPLDARVIASMNISENELLEFVVYCRDKGIITRSGYEVAPFRLFNDKEKAEWEDVFTIINRVLRKGLTDFANTLNVFGVGIKKVYNEYDMVVTDYIRKSAEQYR